MGFEKLVERFEKEAEEFGLDPTEAKQVVMIEDDGIRVPGNRYIKGHIYDHSPIAWDDLMRTVALKIMSKEVQKGA